MIFYDFINVNDSLGNSPFISYVQVIFHFHAVIKQYILLCHYSSNFFHLVYRGDTETILVKLKETLQKSAINWCK